MCWAQRRRHRIGLASSAHARCLEAHAWRTVDGAAASRCTGADARFATQTAVGIAKEHAHLTAPGAPFWIDDRLQERGFGSLEGIVYGVPGVRKRDSIDGIEQMNE